MRSYVGSISVASVKKTDTGLLEPQHMAPYNQQDFEMSKPFCTIGDLIKNLNDEKTYNYTHIYQPGGCIAKHEAFRKYYTSAQPPSGYDRKIRT